MDSLPKNGAVLSPIPLGKLSRDQLEQHRRNLAKLLEQLTERLASPALRAPSDDIVARTIAILNLKTFESMVSHELRQVEILLATARSRLDEP